MRLGGFAPRCTPLRLTVACGTTLKSSALQRSCPVFFCRNDEAVGMPLVTLADGPGLKPRLQRHDQLPTMAHERNSISR